jgi:hypothetical protein
MGLRTRQFLLGMLVIGSSLTAETTMRILSVSYGLSQANFATDNGSNYSLEQYTVASDLIGLEERSDRFPWIGLGTSIFVRYESAELDNTSVSGNSKSGSVSLQEATYHFDALAPSVMLELYPFPDLKPLEPFIEARLEVYEFAETTISNPTVDRYRPMLQIGVRSTPNETGYFWGARLYLAKRGYSGDFGGVEVPDPYVIGLQVDWIGLVTD